MRKWKPTKEELERWIHIENKSFRQIRDLTGYSITTISKWLDQYEIEKPSVGRKKGYKVSEETRMRMSIAAQKDRNQG